MIEFYLNGEPIIYKGNEELTLIKFLRNEKHLTSVKDGCSGQGICGACTVEIDGKPRLACTTKLKSLNNTKIYTLEGLPQDIIDIIAKSFVKNGAVQCGFCTPGFISRAWFLLKDNKKPTLEEIRNAIKPNLCRCTGYKKIEESIELSRELIKNNQNIEIEESNTLIGKSYRKLDAYQTAIGKRNFTGDLFFENMLFGALLFTEHPRAKILEIDTTLAEQINGVVKIFKSEDIPGDKTIGLIFKDWPLMIAVNETTNCIGDVLAMVVAETEDIAREAVKKIRIKYEILPAVTDVFEALKESSPNVHPGKSNILDKCIVKRGNANNSLKNSEYTAKGNFSTQRIEHGFLEPECAVALPENNDEIILYSSGQGIYVDRRQCAQILNKPEEKIRVIQVASGGGFGGKEDLTVQGHAVLAAHILQTPVRVALSREESIRMHPKRHPVFMEMEIGADKNGKLTALKLISYGDSGAYASVGNKVMERVAGHATGGYYIPDIDLESLTIYTNNIPSGAMRGFGVNQIVFALENLIDELCEKGNFDRWQFRWDNALTDGLQTATGQKVYQVGIRACLEKLKKHFYESKFAGIATGIKNSGVGNGMLDSSDVMIEIKSEKNIIIHHGWTEMGQGVHTIAIQTLCNETGINPTCVTAITDTKSNLVTGMTTSSRATVLLGNAVIDAAKKIKADLEKTSLQKLEGKNYFGKFECNWTTKPGANVEEPVTHYAYGYAAQLCVLDETGKIDKFYAAHDAGKIMNQTLFAGQIEGAVAMGIGYALTENLPMKDGYLISDKLKDCKILRAHEIPDIIVYGVEINDATGPYGAKGIGEIGMVPTAAAVTTALYQFDKIRRYQIPTNINI